MSRRTRARLAAVLGALFLLAAVSLVPGLARVANAAPQGSSVVESRIVSREDLNADGTQSTVDTRTVSVSVSQTKDLRGMQQIDVSWSGAHPTGGVALDPYNGETGVRQEYPVVLLECRGIDTPGVPANQRVDPTTCFTQTPAERYTEDNNFAFPPWRLDRYAVPAQRKAIAGLPDPIDPSVCRPDTAPAQHYLPVSAADGKVYYATPGDRCGQPAPDQVTAPDKAAQPQNTMYAPTGTDGTGSVKFVVWTDQQNATLGCSSVVPCALVVVPVMGVSCDANGVAGNLAPEDVPDRGAVAKATAECTATGRYQPGEALGSSFPATDPTAVQGGLWWSASNWRNRISVPLTFAAPASFCSTFDTRNPLLLLGSELMGEATDQWSPAFCKDPRLFKFQHVRMAEPQAKGALTTGGSPAVLVSRPPGAGWGTGTTLTAPVAVSGFAISYAIDYGADDSVPLSNRKHQYVNLRLTPRLLAKLLTESYWGLQSLQTDFLAIKPFIQDPPATADAPPPPGRPNPLYVYHAMATNPGDLALDPDFRALNPGVGIPVDNVTASTLLAISGNSDVMYALTSYINADPEARAFLDGRPDPWGMVVNPTYRGIALPLESWPQLDVFDSPTISLGDCLKVNGEILRGNPILPLIASPVAQLSTIALAMQYAVSNAHTQCKALDPNGNNGGTLAAVGRQPPGSRFMLALTTLGDANYYGLRTAALQSSPGNFVAPNDGSMRAAIATVKPDPTTDTWPIDYAKLHGAEGATAYPGTMVVYLATSTSGLDPTIAEELAQFLGFAAIGGQQQGFDQGEIPPGYLPMTAANGMCDMVFFAQQVAAAIADQQGDMPSPGPCLAPPPKPQVSGGAAAPQTPDAGAQPSAAPITDLPSWKPELVLPRAYTTTATSGIAEWALPAAALVAVLALVTALATRAGVTMRMASSISYRLSQLAELRRRP